MGKKISIFPLLLLFLFILFSGYLFYLNNSLKKELTAIKNENDRLSNLISTLDKDKGEQGNQQNNFPGLSDLNIRRFKKKGIADPANYIVDNLLKSPKLIPVEGTMGGTPYFDRSSTWILSKQWVYTVFSDGHFEGKALLKYEIADDQKINWKVIDYYLE